MICNSVTIKGEPCRNHCIRGHTTCISHFQNCVICLKNAARGDDMATLDCGHVFHSSCIYKWCDEHHQCPVCRFPIKTPCNVQVKVNPGVFIEESKVKHIVKQLSKECFTSSKFYIDNDLILRNSEHEPCWLF